jgi:mono/diheme cytochrome c family protein
MARSFFFMSAAALVVVSAVPARAAPPPRGRALYNQACASCHMPDGSGVAEQQPALAGSAVVAGPPARLIRLLLHGAADALPENRQKYWSQMPTFETLTDVQIADVLTFVRTSFGNKASAVTAAQAAAERSKP